MSRVIILHGKPDEDEYFNEDHPSPSNSHWIPWLQKQLQIAGHDAQTPEVFHAFRPDHGLWCREFERYLTDEPMIFVGHSCGGGFLVRWLSEHPAVSVTMLVLVAPWLDPKREETTDFFEFVIDDRLPERVGELHIFHSTDDMPSIHSSVSILLTHFPAAQQHRYDDMGHFCFEDMGTKQFPDLLRAITGESPAAVATTRPPALRRPAR